MRPSNPTISQLREITQPPSVTGRKNAEHWVADIYLRNISPYLTRALLKTGISANGVTWLMILTGSSISIALLIPKTWAIFLALFLSQLQMLWDCCDGEIARWKESYSPRGIFLDKVGHYFAEGLIPIALGLRLAGWPENPLENSIYPFLGALLAVLVVINKGLNDAVHVARAFSGLPRVADAHGVNQPRGSFLRSLRSLARFIPFHRAYHSVEMSLIIAVTTIIELTFDKDLLSSVFIVLVIASPIVTLGHLVGILSSSKLDSQN